MTPTSRSLPSRAALARLAPLTALGPALLLAAGCAVLQPPSATEIREQTGSLDTLGLDQPYRAAPDGAPEASVQDNWLASFGDPQLDALVAEAIANNADLRVAAVRVEQADAYVELAKSALRPQVGVFATGGGKSSGGDLSSALQGVAFGVSWEPDLWGRLRYGRNATQETRAAVAADYEFARQSIAATVARTWFTATLAGEQYRRTESMTGATAKLVELAEQRQRVGVGDEQEIAGARAELGNLEESLLALRLTQEQSLRALELLLGRYPAAELSARTDLPALPGAVPVGLPLELLERRPDLVAAERRVAAAFDRVGEAKAARLPRLALNASVSAVSSEVLQLKPDFENPSAGFGARLMAPIYQGGALKTQVEIRTLEQKEAVADYARMALRALGDVEQSLATAENLEARAGRLERVLGDRERTLALANEQYRVGRGDLRAVRRQEIDVESANLALLAIRAAQLAERVNLHLALGGSFAAPPEPEEDPAEAPPSEPG
jgi:outer membrane protein, multidrug efflux system